MFQGFLGSFRQRVVLFFKRFAAQIIERQGGVIAAQAYADGVEAAGFSNDGDSAAAPGGGLLIDFFDQPAFNKLTRNFRYAGRGKLALFRNLIREMGPC